MPEANGYTTKWYEEFADSSRLSAQIILSLLFRHYQPSSFLDIGCGPGGWLQAALSLGVEHASGIDGAWSSSVTHNMRDENVLINYQDLEDPLDLISLKRPRYDLISCLEVAEHLSLERCTLLIREITSAADVVLFSAALPGQGGLGHINCQPLNYWVNLFASRSFVHHDILRPAIWRDRRVSWWYRQNIMLYIRESHPLNEILKKEIVQIHNIEHPCCLMTSPELIANYLDRSELLLLRRIVNGMDLS